MGQTQCQKAKWAERIDKEMGRRWRRWEENEPYQDLFDFDD